MRCPIPSFGPNLGSIVKLNIHNTVLVNGSVIFVPTNLGFMCFVPQKCFVRFHNCVCISCTD